MLVAGENDGPQRAAGAVVGGNATDEELVRRFSSGDASAFEELTRRHCDALYRFVRWHLGATRGEAEDVTQDVLIEIHRSLGRFEGRSRLRTWMFGLARNVCLRRRRATLTAASDRIARAVGEQELHDLPDGNVDLEAALGRREVREQVRSAIDGLGPEHRSVVLLREIEGFSYEEIATVLKIPIGTVRSRLHNARAALAESLAPLVRTKGEGR